MEKPKRFRYFLGANSRSSFHSLYSGFCPADEGCFLHVIKGGPGCGKSSFMRKVGAAAEEKGLFVEYVLCSGDPDSLDGVFIPALGLGYVDGTAPHVIEAAFPGSCSAYLDLGRFYNSTELRRCANSIMDINRPYKALYSLAYGYISAAAALMARNYPDLWGDAQREKIRKKAAGFAKREFPSGAASPGRSRQCFMSALSCKGHIAAVEMLEDHCERLCVLDNELGMGNYFLEQLLPTALASGLETLVCRDCIEPERIEALVFPSLSLALCCSAEKLPPEKAYRHIRLDALADRELLAFHRPTLRRSAKLSHETFSLAVDTLAEAKALHDELEAIYNGFVDFDGVYDEAEKHIKALL